MPDWEIFKDGCPGGDSVASMTARADQVVERVKTIHADYWVRAQQGKSALEKGGDVLIVTHGHFSKCFLARFTQQPLEVGRAYVVDAGAVSIGGYQHHEVSALDWRCILADR